MMTYATSRRNVSSPTVFFGTTLTHMTKSDKRISSLQPDGRVELVFLLLKAGHVTPLIGTSFVFST